jgi:hypothetical protein
MNSREINFWANVIVWPLLLIGLAAIAYCVAGAWNWFFAPEEITWGEAFFGVTVILIVSRVWPPSRT